MVVLQCTLNLHLGLGLELEALPLRCPAPYPYIVCTMYAAPEETVKTFFHMLYRYIMTINLNSLLRIWKRLKQQVSAHQDRSKT